jgi:hypothetical protein
MGAKRIVGHPTIAARHSSLSGAASELKSNPAAVSQQVRLLELRLGKTCGMRVIFD